MTGMRLLFPLELQPNSLYRRPPPAPLRKKIGERDVRESPSSPIFSQGRGVSVHRLQPNFSTMRQSSLRKQPSLSAYGRQGRFAWGISPGETSLAARRLCSQAKDRDIEG